MPKGRLAEWSALAGIILASGCASTGDGPAGRLARSLEAVKAELNEISGQVEQMASLATGFGAVVEGQGDLKAHYARFSDAVRAVEARDARLRARAADFRAREEAYLEAWEKELAAAGGGAARRDAIATAFGEVEMVARGVRASFDLLIEDVRAIRARLENDLTAAGVAAVEDGIRAAALDAAAVRKGIDAIVASMEDAGRELPGP